jgi:hypothetical protein
MYKHDKEEYVKNQIKDEETKDDNKITPEKKEGDIMSTIKPIQATPVLSGNDALNLMKQVLKKPSESAIKKNNMLLNILHNIKK